jgi:hypothetical protein
VRLLSFLLFALALTLAVVACGGSGPDRDAYVKANDALYSQLPLFPGAKLAEKDTTSWGKDDGRTILGYSTRYVLDLPQSAKANKIESFYRHRLREPKWHLNERLEGPGLGGPVLNYVNGRAHVSINLANAPVQMEIAVDHDHRE